ncbi:hypothetical protein ACP70R_004088 [Stipagrostis hirtigluma subsp. patula]
MRHGRLKLRGFLLFCRGGGRWWSRPAQVVTSGSP